MRSADWLESLPAAVAPQRDLLRRLLGAVEPNPWFLWLQLSCSLAEGRGDNLSDLDLGLGVAEEYWDCITDVLPTLLESLAPPVAALYHRLPQMGDHPHLRAFIQYSSGVQIDLVAVPAHLPGGRKPEDVMLYDPEGLRAQTWDRSVLGATPETVYEWTFLGWVALADLAKYAHRGSPWEALERLHDARTQVWRLWSVARGLRYPGFGLTEVFDHPGAGAPPGIEATAAVADLPAILRSACACAALLHETSREAARVTEAPLPDSFARLVRDQLTEVERDFPGP